MATATVNLLELSNSQKLKVLRQARTFLQRQLAEARFCKSFADNRKIPP